MIINITQHCTLKCPHCMQNAGPERNEYMSEETFRKALDYAYDINAHVINITGGEPTSHSQFLSFLDIALHYQHRQFILTVLSNGTFLQNHKFVEEFAKVVKAADGRVTIQISSFAGLYDNYDDVHKPGSKAIRMFGERITIADENNTVMQMQPLGRASSGKYFDQARLRNLHPSCTNTALILAQEENAKYAVGRAMETHARFCSPMVSWDGSIRLGESEQCKIIANIFDGKEKIHEALANFKPCGGCAAYKWHYINPQTEQDKIVCGVLGIKHGSNDSK